MFSKSMEYQAVEGSNKNKESYILLMLWRITKCGEKFYT